MKMESMSKQRAFLYVKFALAVLSAIYLCFICIAAGAATLKGNKESCMALSNVTMQAGELRDSGVTWVIFEARLKEMLLEATNDPKSFVHTEDEVTFVVKSMRLLWNNPQDAPILVASAVYQSCMGK